MNVLKDKSRMSVVVRLCLAAALAAGLAGCGKKRGAAVRGPGDARPVGPADGMGRAGDGSSDIAGGLSPDGGRAGDFTMGDESSPLADVNFEYDSAGLTSTAMDVLNRHALWLKDHPGSRVTLEGHCDERGTVEYNLALGEQRARAVYDYLTSLGVPGTRLSTMSFGKERPLVMGSGETSWAKNRRVHFAVSG
jgi:peptidoglycan-associated lipoprotein